MKLNEDAMSGGMSERDDLWGRYQAALHAVQSAVLFEIELFGEDTAGASPKHLRVGVNSALVDTEVLVRLLVEKGIITEMEHLRMLVQCAERERDRMTERLRRRTGRPLTFG